MKKIRNYQIAFMDGSSINVTAEAAYQISSAWAQGLKSVTVNSEVFACHQITSIKLDRMLEADDALEYYGVALLPNQLGYNAEEARAFRADNTLSLAEAKEDHLKLNSGKNGREKKRLAM